MKTYEGTPVSSGITISWAFVIDKTNIKVPKENVLPQEISIQMERLKSAVSESERQFEEARQTIKKTGSSNSEHSLILKSHLLILEDELFIKGASELIKKDLINAEWAVLRKMSELKEILSGLNDDYFKERSEDVDFVGKRVLKNLMGHEMRLIRPDSAPCAVVAHNLSPLEITQMIEAPILAFAMETGTKTSHTAIMAQSLGIPAAVGIKGISNDIDTGDVIIIDGSDGVVIVSPDDDTLLLYRKKAAEYNREKVRLSKYRDKPAVTEDGTKIELMANIEFPGETTLAIDQGASGIGLYRTEFLLMRDNKAVDEDEQFKTYRTVVNTMGNRSVVFRTFDFGADKSLDCDFQVEPNPALGLRAIRIGLKNPISFKVQLRAMLRAARHGTTKIMFPMISGVTELREVKKLLVEAEKELGGDLLKNVKIGCMIELPSAVFVADQLAKEVDFFSIGTNDLIQYSLAIDRSSDVVSYLYTPFHPSVIKAIQMTVKAAKKAEIDVSVCGTMASEPLIIPVFIGLGIRELSMAPSYIPIIKSVITAVNVKEAQKLTKKVLNADTSTAVEEMVREYFNKKIK